jgi:hypothetical protein
VEAVNTLHGHSVSRERYILIVERDDIGWACFGPYSTHGSAVRAGGQAEKAGCEWSVEYLGSPRGMKGVVAEEDADA